MTHPTLTARLLVTSAFLPLLLQTPAAEAQRTRTPAPRATTQQGYQLTFVDADAKRVAEAVLGAMLGVDYSIDPEVSGTVTLRTASPVPRDQLLPLLESALRPAGAVVVVEGGRYRVMPRAAARGQAPLTGQMGGAPRNGPSPTTGGPLGEPGMPDVGDVTPGFATEVIPLRAASAEQIGRMITQFLGEGVVGAVEPGQNRITITGSAEERRAARQIIARFDVDTLADMQFDLVRLETVDAGTLASELRRIFQPPYDIIGSRVRVIPLPRLRSILLVAQDRGDIDRVRPWITRLDSGAAGRRRLYSYVVQNGRARDVARILQRVLGMGGDSSTDEATGQNPAQSPAANLSDSFGTTGGAGTSGGTARTPPTLTANADAHARDTDRTDNATAQPRSGGPRVIASDETNSLLIYADGEEYEFIRDALSRLDQPVPQVLIEAVLAEVTLTRDLRYGVNFNVFSGNWTGTNSSSSGRTPASVFPGFSVNWVGSSAAAVLNTLQSRTNVRVLSSPKLVVLNNQTATLQVGDQVPIVTQQVQGVSAPGAPIVNNVEMRDTGVILRVTPRVNESGTVTLDINQEVSDVARTTTSGINSPTIQQRRIASVVATRSGEMVALGGLIRDRTVEGRAGIPLLSQIPIVGGLFGNHSREGTRTELIILLTPTVIRAPQDAQGVVRQLIDALDRAGPLVESGIARQLGGQGVLRVEGEPAPSTPTATIPDIGQAPPPPGR